MKPHDVVDVLSGPYAGMRGQVERYDSDECRAFVSMHGFEVQEIHASQLRPAAPPSRWEQRRDAQEVAQYARERMLERECGPSRRRHVVAESAMRDKTAKCLSCGVQLELSL